MVTAAKISASLGTAKSVCVCGAPVSGLRCAGGVRKRAFSRTPRAAQVVHPQLALEEHGVRLVDTSSVVERPVVQAPLDDLIVRKIGWEGLGMGEGRRRNKEHIGGPEKRQVSLHVGPSSVLGGPSVPRLLMRTMAAEPASLISLRSTGEYERLY